MIPELQWLLLALPVTFALGWMASRFDLRQLKREQRDNPRAYFKGLNLLLNEQQDKAIDAFIEAVQNDPDTAELHFALGNLFRRRGELERAVRVHEHLLSRADLKPHDRARAQQALAQDFMRAGLFDRAEEAWLKLEGTSFDSEARLALMTLHERARDWARAVAMAEELQRRGEGNFAARLAHYHCELALEADSRGNDDAADQAMAKARAVAPQAARPLVLAGQRLARQGRHLQALHTWDELQRHQPLAFSLVADDYASSALAADQAAWASASSVATESEPAVLGTKAEVARVTLTRAYEQTPSMAVLKALHRLQTDPVQVHSNLLAHIRQRPTLSAAQALLAQPPPTWGEDGLTAVRTAVDNAARPLQRYRCAACGFEAKHWFWQCPGCLGWDSFPPQAIEEL